MKSTFVISISFLFQLITTSLSAPVPTDTYANSIELEPNSFYLLWNYTSTDILMETHVKTSGWAGFGLSPNGGMDGSNVVVFWVDAATGKANFTARHIRGRDVLVNKAQNWMPLLVTRRGEYLVAKFTRKIKICDKTNEDMDIPDGTPRVIYSYGSRFNRGNIAYHDFRGTKALQLISSLNTKVEIDMSQVETAEFRVNFTLDNEFQTTYYCQMFKLPSSWSAKKRHLIRYETLFTPETKSNLHHWSLNECDMEFETVFLKNNSMPEPGVCVNDMGTNKQWDMISSYCKKPSFVWAVGGAQVQDFPADLAYPIGGDDSFKYFFLQIHFDNPRKLENLKDNSGVKLYVTENHRKTEFGVLTIGSIDWPSILLPPNVPRVHLDFTCQNNCTNRFFDQVENVTIFATMPHTHLAGREVYAKLIRDGQEVEYIANNKYYNFNYQTYNFLPNPVTFKKGDQLKATCVYNTVGRTNFTTGGFSSQREMCVVFVWYYPKTSNVSICGEMVKPKQWMPFFHDLIKSGDLISASLTDSNETRVNLPKSGAKPELLKKFNEFYLRAERSQQCFPQEENSISIDSPLETIRPIQEPTCVTDTDYYYSSPAAKPIS